MVPLLILSQCPWARVLLFSKDVAITSSCNPSRLQLVTQVWLTLTIRVFMTQSPGALQFLIQLHSIYIFYRLCLNAGLRSWDWHTIIYSPNFTTHAYLTCKNTVKVISFTLQWPEDTLYSGHQVTCKIQRREILWPICHLASTSNIFALLVAYAAIILHKDLPPLMLLCFSWTKIEKFRWCKILVEGKGK